MRPPLNSKKFGGLLFVLAGLLGGCGTTDEGGGASVSGGAYYGMGLYDPWYYGGYIPPDVIVTPPERPAPPPRPEHPIAKPPPVATPRPMPSIPSAPRPAFRR
jgi:hypothetical protein